MCHKNTASCIMMYKETLQQRAFPAHSANGAIKRLQTAIQGIFYAGS